MFLKTQAFRHKENLSFHLSKLLISLGKKNEALRGLLRKLAEKSNQVFGLTVHR